MKRLPPNRPIMPGMTVYVSRLADATPWTVLEVDGFNLTIREAGTSYAPQIIDVCQVKEVMREG